MEETERYDLTGVGKEGTCMPFTVPTAQLTLLRIKVAQELSLTYPFYRSVSIHHKPQPPELRG